MSKNMYLYALSLLVRSVARACTKCHK